MTGAIVAALVTGAVGGTAFNAIQSQAAETANATSSPSADQQTQPMPPQNNGQFDPSKGGHVGANGKKEELLTGDTAEKVKAAALAKYPGGTIERVETDADGATYEAHMTTADGSRVTVLFDANYNVTGTETGRPGGSHGQTK